MQRAFHGYLDNENHVNNGLLDVDVAPFKRGYGSMLRVVYGSFHVLDDGLFYENIRENALLRMQAWQTAQHN